jgi:hypothetical protein
MFLFKGITIQKVVKDVHLQGHAVHNGSKLFFENMRLVGIKIGRILCSFL